MSQYAPTSRRPIAAGFRRTAEAATQFCVRNEIHPDDDFVFCYCRGGVHGCDLFLKPDRSGAPDLLHRFFVICGFV
jgi:hypothetical protein